jgi:hypothetical protein
MGENTHKNHEKSETCFTNTYLKKYKKIKRGVGLVSILLMALILLVHFGLTNLADNDKWTIIIAIFAALVSILFAVTNITIKNKQLDTSNLFKVFELLSSQDIRNSRKVIHNKYHEFNIEQKKIYSKTEAETDADIVLSSFDQVSATVLNELLDKDLFFDTYGEMIVRDWKTLKDEIEFRQSKNKKVLRHFTFLKNDFEERLRKDSRYKDSDTDPY